MLAGYADKSAYAQCVFAASTDRRRASFRGHAGRADGAGEDADFGWDRVPTRRVRGDVRGDEQGGEGQHIAWARRWISSGFIMPSTWAMIIVAISHPANQEHVDLVSRAR